MQANVFTKLWARLAGQTGDTLAVPPVAPTSAGTYDDRIVEIAATKLTKPAEGTFLRPYQDPGGVWTIGTGATRDLQGNPVTAETPTLTPAQNDLLLHRDMLAALQVTQGDVKVALTEDENAALLDFVFNLGAGAFAKSNVLRDLNAGNFAQAANDLLVWDHAGGVELAGLAKRCAARRALFLTPDSAAAV